jgi:hypothetical protein
VVDTICVSTSTRTHHGVIIITSEFFTETQSRHCALREVRRTDPSSQNQEKTKTQNKIAIALQERTIDSVDEQWQLLCILNQIRLLSWSLIM